MIKIDEKSLNMFLKGKISFDLQGKNYITEFEVLFESDDEFCQYGKEIEIKKVDEINEDDWDDVYDELYNEIDKEVK